MNNVYEEASKFLNKYSSTVAFRVAQHSKVIEEHLDDDEELKYVFVGQKNEKQIQFPHTAVIALTSVLIVAAMDKVDEINEARQPLVFMPLMNNGLPYQAGIVGFELNSYTDSFLDNAKRNFEAGKRVIGNVYEAATDPDELSKSLTMLKQAKISLPSTFEF